MLIRRCVLFCFQSTMLTPSVNTSRVYTVVDSTPFDCFPPNASSTAASVARFESTAKIRSYPDKPHLSPDTQARLLRHYMALPEVFYHTLAVTAVGPPSRSPLLDGGSFAPFRKNSQTSSANDGLFESGPDCKNSWHLRHGDSDSHAREASVPVDARPSSKCVGFLYGPGTFSATCCENNFSVSPPLEYRYGWNLAEVAHQQFVLRVLLTWHVALLAGAPNCSPWSANSGQWPEEVRRARRESELPGFLFLSLHIPSMVARTSFYC